MLIRVGARRIFEGRHRFGGEAGEAAEVGGVGDAEMRVAEGASVVGESLGGDGAVGKGEAGVSSQFYEHKAKTTKSEDNKERRQQRAKTTKSEDNKGRRQLRARL